MPVINGVYLKDFAALPSSVTDANIIPIAITGNQIAYRTTVGGIVTDARVTSKLLTGLSVTGGAIASTDTILQAFGKVQNQINSKVSSVGLTMPSAFNVANSPITSSGTLAVTAAGVASQYIRGDGALADFPTNGGGGSSVSYYLNGSVSQGTIGGNTYYEMNKTPVIGTGTDFTINANGYIAQFITDANDPGSLLIPGGNWSVEMYFSASSNGGNPSFYVEVYKYNGTTFTLLGSSATTPEGITNGTAIDIYYTSVGIPETVLTITDRLAIRVYVTHSGRTITLHTEDNHLSEIVTTFSNGINTLNGLTKQAQYFAVGSTGTDFAIVSSVDTHTFNLPTASATNRGALSSADWTTFNNKQGTITLTTTGTSGAATLVGNTLNVPNYADGGVLSLSAIGASPNANAATITGTVLNLQPASASFGGVVTTGTQTFAGDKTFTGNINASPTSGNAIQAITTSSVAIQVQSTTGDGVQANSTTGAAISGNASGTLGRGVVGQASGTGGAAGDFTASANAAYAVYANATGSTAYAFYGSANSASFPVQSLIQSGLGSIALFGNSGGTVATITNSGGLTLAGQLSLGSTITNGTYTYTLPSATGTLALTSALSGYLPLTGGTLTGALSGTSATFSGTVTVSNADPLTYLQLANTSAGGQIYTLISAGVSNPHSEAVGTFYIRNSSTSTTPFRIASTGAATFSGNVASASFSSTGQISTGNGADADILINVTAAGAATKYASIQSSVSGRNLVLNPTNGGNVGIGTTAPTVKLEVGGASNTDSTGRFFKTSEGTLLLGGNRSTSNCPFIGSENNYDFAFITNNTERMRITSGGELCIAKTSTAFGTVGHAFLPNGQVSHVTDGSTAFFLNRLSSDGDIALFYRSSISVGSISVTSSATAYNTSSDYRLKQDLKDFKGLDLISAIKTYNYEWKTDSTRAYGVLAHELQEVLPQAVYGEKDAEEMQGVDYSKLVPVMIKAIQEQQAQIEELKALIK